MSRKAILTTEHVLGIASASASLIIVISFFLFPDLRQLRYIQLVFFVALNDMIASIAISMGRGESGTFVCWFQGMTVILNYLSSIFWTVVISYQVWLVLERKQVIQNMTMIHVICWGLPVVLTLLPLSTNTFGESSAFFNSEWCFIAERDGSPAWSVTFWAIASFFFWILSSLFLTVFFLIRVYFIISRMMDMPEISNYTLQKLVFYPLITVVCWLPACLIYFLALNGETNDRKYNWNLANSFALSTAVAQGLLNSAAFLANNELVRSKWIALFSGDFSVLRVQYVIDEEQEGEARPYSIFSLPDFLTEQNMNTNSGRTMQGRETELSRTNMTAENSSSTQSDQIRGTQKKSRQISSDSGFCSSGSGFISAGSGVLSSGSDANSSNSEIINSPLHGDVNKA